MGSLAAGAARQAIALMHERSLWERGLPAAAGSYEGEVEIQRVIFRSYKLTVKYTDLVGQEHSGRLEFSALGGSLDKEADGEIRYDPDHPDDFVLSKALDMSGARWTSIGLFGLFGTAMFAITGWLAFRTVRDLKRTLSCARDGRPVEVLLLGPPGRDQYGNATYKYRVVGESTDGKVHVAVLKKLGEPVPVRNDATRALGVRSASDPNAVLLLRSDGFPFMLPPEARDAMREGAEQGHFAGPSRSSLDRAIRDSVPPAPGGP